MQKTAEEYQKDLLWQTALETFYRVAYAESLMTAVPSDLETGRWVH